MESVVRTTDGKYICTFSEEEYKTLQFAMERLVAYKKAQDKQKEKRVRKMPKHGPVVQIVLPSTDELGPDRTIPPTSLSSSNSGAVRVK